MGERDVLVASFAELSPETAYRIWQLRERVFVVEQGCAYQELDGRDLEPTTRHLWVQDAVGVTAYLRVLAEPGSRARIGRVCVDQPARSRGLARGLMDAALGEIRGRESVLDAQSHLAVWYAGWGYEVAGPEFLEDDIPHLPMRRPPSA